MKIICSSALGPGPHCSVFASGPELNWAPLVILFLTRRRRRRRRRCCFLRLNFSHWFVSFLCWCHSSHSHVIFNCPPSFAPRWCLNAGVSHWHLSDVVIQCSRWGFWPRDTLAFLWKELFFFWKEDKSFVFCPDLSLVIDLLFVSFFFLLRCFFYPLFVLSFFLTCKKITILNLEQKSVKPEEIHRFQSGFIWFFFFSKIERTFEN